MNPESPVIHLLKTKKLKTTVHRLDVLDYLFEQRKPLLLNELQDYFTKTINRVTLYRILNDFEEKDLVRIFHGLSGQKYIEFKAQDKVIVKHGHVHFQCEICSEIYCFDDVEISALPKGFLIKPEKTVLTGTCSVCKQ
jgi:Fur family transcriptional regulator, ferric uptake regulator